MLKNLCKWNKCIIFDVSKKTYIMKTNLEFDVEYRDEEGDNYESSFDTKEEAMKFIRKIKNEDCSIVQTWKYVNGDYVGSFY